MAEARKQDTGMDMFPGNERPTRSNVSDPTNKTVTSGAGNMGPVTSVTVFWFCPDCLHGIRTRATVTVRWIFCF